jgi:8-oxo-dGTP pyrophosphatase MutT (NUDIX family)
MHCGLLSRISFLFSVCLPKSLLVTETAIPAATLVVMRERDGASPDLLMVERTARMAFAGGAMVFPGGRVDEEDRALAAGYAEADAPFRIAAIRETLEESGIPVGIEPLPQIDLAAQLQDALHAGSPFGALLAANGLALRLDALTPFARWKPSFHQARIFDTIFFIAEAPAGDWQPRPQQGECEAVEWLGAREVLDRVASGEASAIFPTVRNLERLAQFNSFAAARADAAAHPIETITPWIGDFDGEPHLFIPEGMGYPVTREPLASVRRGVGEGIFPAA